MNLNQNNSNRCSQMRLNPKVWTNLTSIPGVGIGVKKNLGNTSDGILTIFT